MPYEKTNKMEENDQKNLQCLDLLQQQCLLLQQQCTSLKEICLSQNRQLDLLEARIRKLEETVNPPFFEDHA